MGLGQSTTPKVENSPENQLDDLPDFLPTAKLYNINKSQPKSFKTVNRSGELHISVSPSEKDLTEEAIPTVITWTEGGDEVFITGTFNDWKEKIPLNKSQRDFTTILYLPPGVHQYKFIVDGKWKHASNHPIAADVRGNLKNCMEVRKFSAMMNDSEKESPFSISSSPPGSYGQFGLENDNSMYLKEPPELPPHLFRALLNTAPVSQNDPILLPLPHHVMINHGYSLNRPPEESNLDDVEVLGATHRYKTKFITTVFYKPSEENNNNNNFDSNNNMTNNFNNLNSNDNDNINHFVDYFY
eukprot:TRINITY_DN110_c6_g1_i1.p1 TRINITY_DN110_c6_g1~~TRINITY_DN110_c6_g1_i1.p1  ORF type:complete len:299 (+),score=84.91 TRINITY_DN110_c6_g1_i1:56-952(+)